MIDQIILSCNEDQTYSEFWPIVATAYKKLFPDVTVHLAFLTDRSETDPMVTEMRRYGRVTLFPIVTGIPQFGQAKMIRFILASEQRTKICYIDDIDLIPLSKKFITDVVESRQRDTLLCVGAEVYGWDGCCPVSQMTAEAYVWKTLINPENLLYTDLIRSWTKYFYDIREKIDIDQIAIPGGFKDDRYFSDERLIRRLLRENPVPIINIKRGYTDYLESTIDRQTVDEYFDKNDWVWDKDKLKRGEYVNCHGARPYSKYKADYDLMMEYLEVTYELSK